MNFKQLFCRHWWAFSAECTNLDNNKYLIFKCCKCDKLKIEIEKVVSDFLEFKFNFCFDDNITLKKNKYNKIGVIKIPIKKVRL